MKYLVIVLVVVIAFIVIAVNLKSKKVEEKVADKQKIVMPYKRVYGDTNVRGKQLKKRRIKTKLYKKHNKRR